jgi:hypothetical protein
LLHQRAATERQRGKARACCEICSQDLCITSLTLGFWRIICLGKSASGSPSFGAGGEPLYAHLLTCSPGHTGRDEPPVRGRRRRLVRLFRQPAPLGFTFRTLWRGEQEPKIGFKPKSSGSISAMIYLVRVCRRSICKRLLPFHPVGDPLVGSSHYH